MSFDEPPSSEALALPKIRLPEVDNRDRAIADLEEKLVSAKDGRCEERFWWIFGTSTVAVYGFSTVAPWGISAILILFHIVVLIALAEKLGVDYVVVHLNRFYYTIRKRWNNEPSTDEL